MAGGVRRSQQSEHHVGQTATIPRPHVGHEDPDVGGLGSRSGSGSHEHRGTSATIPEAKRDWPSSSISNLARVLCLLPSSLRFLLSSCLFGGGNHGPLSRDGFGFAPSNWASRFRLATVASSVHLLHRYEDRGRPRTCHDLSGRIGAAVASPTSCRPRWGKTSREARRQVSSAGMGKNERRRSRSTRPWKFGPPMSEIARPPAS
jgi:hypothetical protein